MSNGILTMVATSGCVVIFGIETLLMAILGVDPETEKVKKNFFDEDYSQEYQEIQKLYLKELKSKAELVQLRKQEMIQKSIHSISGEKSYQRNPDSTKEKESFSASSK